MRELQVKDFSLMHSLECGQFFRYEKIGSYYFITTANNIIKVRQDGSKLFFTSNNDLGKKFIQQFFGLDDNYKEIISSISKDELIRKAVSSYYGLRIIRQEPFECLMSYICSSFSNIPRIKKCISNISRNFGKEISLGSYKTYSFPTIINNYNKLSSCGLGYRCSYLHKTAGIISSDYFDKIKKLGYSSAKKELMKLPGVGTKVADCVLLYSLGFLNAVPMDVWMKRTTDKYYEGRDFQEYFGRYAGYAQQFLFYYARNKRIAF